MRFDWTDLQVFLHACEAGSMTAAAGRCHLTVAAVSARLRQLEDANGMVLLHRHARGVSPTAAGDVLARHARLVFEQVQRLERDLLHAQPAAVRPRVLLANSASLQRALAPAWLPLSEGDDAPPLLVRESASEATVQALRSGAADVGIVSDAVDTRGLVAHALGPDPLAVVVARTHALAHHASLAFRQVLELPWIAWGEQGALSTHLLLRAVALGRPLQPRITWPQLEGVLQFVAHGAGVTVLPQAVVQAQRGGDGVACIPLQDPWARRTLLACHAGGTDPLRDRLARSLARHWR